MLYNNLKFPDIFLEDSSIIVTLNISNDGLEFTNKTLETIITYLDEDYCKGILIIGDSFCKNNRKEVHDLAQTIRAIFGDSKKIYLNTKYSLSEIIAMRDLIVDELVRYVDSI